MPQSKKPKPKPKATSSSTSRPAAARKAKDATASAAAPKRRPVAQAAPGDAEAAAARDEALRSNIGALRDVLAGGVVLTAQRLQETLDDAVSRGRLTKDDAERLMTGLLSIGRQQTQDVLGELEQIVDKGRSDLDVAARRVRGASDKVRRAAKIGGFPIERYDELTAAAVSAQLGDLTPADLRRVRDYEKRNANRKSVLAAIDKQLG